MDDRSDDIIPHIPSLLRHAKLIAGTAELGTEYVRMCLELVLAEPHRVAGADIRLQLFKALYAILLPDQQDQAPAADLDGPTDHVIRRRLSQMAPPARRVLLLVEVERFTPLQAQQILGLDAAEMRRQLDFARGEFGRQLNLPVLIVEADAMTAMRLNEIVQELGFTVVTVAADRETALRAAASHPPGLMLVDLQLRDGDSGIATAKAILAKQPVPIIYLTGAPPRLLQQQGLGQAFVVTKPIGRAELSQQIGRAIAAHQALGEPRAPRRPGPLPI